MAAKEPLVDGSKERHLDVAEFFPPAPMWVDQVYIAAGTNTTYTIPAQIQYIIISAPSGSFWVKVNAAAVVPAAGITDGTGSLLRPTQLNVRGITSLGFIASDAMYVTIAAYL